MGRLETPVSGVPFLEYQILTIQIKDCDLATDPYDVEVGNGACGPGASTDDSDPNTDAIYPDTEFCLGWLAYRDACLVANTETNDAWGHFMLHNTGLFNSTISNPSNCISTEEMEEIICLNMAVEQFNIDYNLNLTKTEKKVIKEGASCDDDNIIKSFWENLIDSKTGNIQNDSDISFLTSFLMESENKTELLTYIEKIAQIRIEDPLVRWDRATELYSLFENDSVLNDCGDVSQWSDLASFVIPDEVNDRVENLGWTNQDIEMGNTKKVNLDYHSINITNLPDIDGDGVTTEQELFEEIRLNWPNYANSQVNVVMEPVQPDIISNNTWSYYENDFNDFWSTDNALKTIIEIDTDVNGWNPITDDATVICSAFENNCCWVFSTIWASQIGNSNNGSHPVSGNRQFGIKQLSDGSSEFYIRAADRARINWLVKSMAWLSGNNSTEIFYEITDQAWNNLMANVVSLINDPNNGGVATQNSPIISRPNWDEVKEKLKSGETMTIPCKY